MMRFFQHKAHELGTVVPLTLWHHEEKPKTSASAARTPNTVASTKAMAVHYDGDVKARRHRQPSTSRGNAVKVQCPPRFKLFTAIAHGTARHRLHAVRVERATSPRTCRCRYTRERLERRYVNNLSATATDA
jgi:hypothetical protein